MFIHCTKDIITYLYIHTGGLHYIQWYETPSNVYKDERILKSDYNQGLKNFKIYIFPQNALIKFDKWDEK